MYKRQAPQSLHLLNSDFSLAMAKRLALQTHSDSTETRVVNVFVRAFGRKPTQREIREAVRFLDEGNPLPRLCLALLNSNEFVFVD